MSLHVVNSDFKTSGLKPDSSYVSCEIGVLLQRRGTTNNH